MQSITNKQLQVTSEQLKISSKFLSDQIYSGRPIIVVLSDKIKDTVKISDNLFKLIIQTTYKNFGRRSADKLSIRTFIVYNDFSKITYGVLNQSHLLKPNSVKINTARSNIDKKHKDDFYFCYSPLRKPD